MNRETVFWVLDRVFIALGGVLFLISIFGLIVVGNPYYLVTGALSGVVLYLISKNWHTTDSLTARATPTSCPYGHNEIIHYETERKIYCVKCRREYSTATTPHTEGLHP